MSMSEVTVAPRAGEATADPPIEHRKAAVQRSRSARGKGSLWLQLQRLATLGLMLGVWQLVSGRWVDDFFLSRPSEVIPELWRWIIDGTVWRNASATVQAALTGFAIGGAIAITFGYVLAQTRRLSQILEPFITAFYGLPKIALVPLLIMWVGIGSGLQITIAALIAFFLMFYNTYFGVREVDRDLIDQVRIMGGGERDLALRVRLPSALVWVVAGLKLSIPQCVVGVVVAEILAGQEGLGYLVAHHANQFNAKGTFAALIVLLAIGFAIDRVIGLLTGRALQWKSASDVHARR